jgi:hypothetical protein
VVGEEENLLFSAITLVEMMLPLYFGAINTFSAEC